MPFLSLRFRVVTSMQGKAGRLQPARLQLQLCGLHVQQSTLAVPQQSAALHCQNSILAPLP